MKHISMITKMVSIMANIDSEIVKNSSGRLSSTLSLFTSFSTLICCALPALLVTLGAGATLATVLSHIPQLIWFSEHKLWVFGFAGLMLSLACYQQCRSRYLPCPTDPQLALVCSRQRRRSTVMLWISIGIYLLGLFFAYLAPLIFF